MAAPLVLALGGSLLRPDESERHAWLSALAEVVATGQLLTRNIHDSLLIYFGENV